VTSFLISSAFAQGYYVENLQQDYTDYEVEKSIFQSISLSALSDGTLYGDPEKVSQVTLFNGMTKIFYPNTPNELFIRYSVFAPASDCPQYTSCMRQELVTEKTIHVENGKNNGNIGFPVENYILNGAQTIKVEQHYIVNVDEELEDYDSAHIDYPLKDFYLNGKKVYQTWVIDSQGSKEERLVTTCDDVAILTKNGAGYSCISSSEFEIIGQNSDGSPIYANSLDSESEGTKFLNNLFDNAQYNTDNGYVEMQNGVCPDGYVGISTEKGVKCTKQAGLDNDQKEEPFDYDDNDTTSYTSLWVVLGLIGSVFLAKVGGIF
jgi:hypothetical protein